MLGIRYIRTEPTTYLLAYRNGRLVREGAGLAFFYFAPSTALVAVPVASREAPFIFEEVTGDFQRVAVQGQVTFRVADPKRTAALLDFTLAADGKSYAAEDPEKLAQRVVNAVQVGVRRELEAMTLREALKAGERIGAAVRARLATAEEITALGLEILALAFLALKPTPETARALEAETRERILQSADEAIYARRNAAVEQERTIKENELNTEIAVELKQRAIRETQLEAESAVQARRHAMARADVDARVALEARNKDLVALAADNARTEADARAYGTTALMKAFDAVDPKVLDALSAGGMQSGQLIARAFRDLAEKADRIGTLNISPDLLRELMTTTDGAARASRDRK
jgi:hypothetical protein